MDPEEQSEYNTSKDMQVDKKTPETTDSSTPSIHPSE